MRWGIEYLFEYLLFYPTLLTSYPLIDPFLCSCIPYLTSALMQLQLKCAHDCVVHTCDTVLIILYPNTHSQLRHQPKFLNKRKQKRYSIIYHHYDTISLIFIFYLYLPSKKSFISTIFFMVCEPINSPPVALESTDNTTPP